MKKSIGWLLVCSPLIALLVSLIIKHGLYEAFVVFSIGVSLTSLCMFGLYLVLFQEEKPKKTMDEVIREKFLELNNGKP